MLFFYSLPPIRQGHEGGCPEPDEDAEAFAVSQVGFLAEEPDCDAGNDADEASVKADGTECLLVQFTTSSLPILLLAYFSKERDSAVIPFL